MERVEDYRYLGAYIDSRLSCKTNSSIPEGSEGLKDAGDILLCGRLGSNISASDTIRMNKLVLSLTPDRRHFKLLRRAGC